MAETSDTPIAGSARQFDFIDDGTIIVEVEDDDGEIWYETYNFEVAERAE